MGQQTSLIARLREIEVESAAKTRELEAEMKKSTEEHETYVTAMQSELNGHRSTIDRMEKELVQSRG